MTGDAASEARRVGPAGAEGAAIEPGAAASGATAQGLRNAMTIDVEDYFQVEAFADRIARETWSSFECRAERNVDRVLDILAERDCCATFFTLGWLAERHPRIVRRIVAMGHELASHGFSHHRADRQTPVDFRADVRRAKRLLEDIGGVAVKGYRAPSFSINASNFWAFDVLAEEGYVYSSSVYPIRHDLYGMPDAPRFPFRPRGPGGILECPISTVALFGHNFPCGGGGYFRLLPYGLSRWQMRRVNRADGHPCIFYFHPWEIDPAQPRLPDLPLKARARHYTNLPRMADRVRRVVREFRWDRMDHIFLPEGRGAA